MTPLPADGILTRITDRTHGIMIEAVYRPTADGRYRNTHWRLYTVPVCDWGTWYKIHGNQKKRINWALPLVCDTVPREESPLTDEEIARANKSYTRALATL